jgi:hypothetical protein
MGPNPTRQRIYNAIAVLIIGYCVATFGAGAILAYDSSHNSLFQFRLACGTVRVLSFHALDCGYRVKV